MAIDVGPAVMMLGQVAVGASAVGTACVLIHVGLRALDWIRSVLGVRVSASGPAFMSDEWLAQERADNARFQAERDNMTDAEKAEGLADFHAMYGGSERHREREEEAASMRADYYERIALHDPWADTQPGE